PPCLTIITSLKTSPTFTNPLLVNGSTASLSTSILPCCVQTPPMRVNTHAAPVVRLSLGPPTMAVFPSAETATDAPWDNKPPPYSPVAPTSLACCLQAPPVRANTHAAPAGPLEASRSRSALLAPGPPTMTVLP